MLKYIVVVILIILGGLLFVNKDKLSSLSGTDNAAVVINSDIAKCGEGGSYINKEGNCYCPQRKSVISWYSVCSLGTTK